MGNVILLLFPAVIHIFTLNYAISKILDRKFNWKGFAITIVPYILIYSIKIQQLKVTSGIIIGFLYLTLGILLMSLIKYSVNVPWFDTGVIFIEYVFITAVTELIMVMFFSSFFSNFDYSYSNAISILGINLVNNLLIILIFKYKRFSLYEIVMKFYSYIKKSPLLQLQGIIILSIIIMMLMSFINIIMNESISKAVIVITGVFFITIFSLTIFLVNRALADVVRTNNLEIQGVYIDTSKQIAEDTRAFWHNYSNVVSGLRSLVEVKDYTKEEMTEMIEDLLKWDSEKSIKDKIAVLNIDNPAIKGIISSKLEKAKQRGINVSLKAENVEKVDMNVIEMIEVLGILLDNAIEFSSQSKSKLIDMELGGVQGKSFKLKIANTFIEKDGKPFKLEDSNNIGFNYINKLSKKLSNKLVFEHKIIEEAFTPNEKLFEVNFII